jgi:hypothetical protein
LANDILRFVLLLVACAAGFAAVWAELLSLQKTGRRYWLINPLAQLESIFTKETGIFLACLAIAAGSVVARNMLK